ncbi:MAG TPA: conjugal transfer protein TraE [Candidatus Eisenbergiella merdigallinarum]|uniref:Conjugal transfer protein TraE n=1 Tax=Candidatus Eisenbergiella merdigallinarum TaxID=2838552 RepID=A0A9D2MPV8_9FIRM|nr:conjugal transfer protein TraE [Candidatus Eisenbergiella merdigallinarum]
MHLTPDKKLTGSEKRRLEAAVKKAKRDGRLPKTAQQTIPYKEMCRDGICVVNDRYFTKQIQFYDINYQLAQNEDKNQIFESYCDFLNYFDSSIHFQLSFLNQRADLEEYQKSIHIPEQNDAYDSIRREYSEMLKAQLAKGNNGLSKTKYITFGVEAESLKAAKPRLERIEADILANFKVLGVKARPLDGYERLSILHRMFHPADSSRFRFAWDAVWKTGLSSKDFIAPDSFSFKSGRTFRIGKTYGAVSFLQILAPELTDRMLADFLDLESSLVLTMHVRSIDQSEAIKTIKRKITDLDKMKIEEQKKAVRSGYDMEILPSDLMTYGTEAKTLLEDLQSRNERMFLVTVLVMNTAPSRQKLENNVFQAAGVAQKYNCALRRLDYQQEQGLVSSLPLGLNRIEIQRGLTTSSTAIFVPFTTQELFMQGDALYYGLNALSNNLIMADRKKLKNPNGLILGTPGSGKSFSAKREITNAFLITTDDIAIIDPEDEYSSLVKRLGGQVIDISPVSDQYINPMDLTLNYSEDDNPLTLKSDFILSLMELIVGGKAGLEPVEKTIIDRCVHLVYRDYLQDPQPEKMPILGDLYRLLREQPEKEAQRLATALEIYVTGSLNVFNHQTNVEIKSRIVCYVIKKLGKQLKKFGMQVVQDQLWGRVSENREAHKSTRVYIDEMHLLLKEEQTAAYTVEIWKRFRKWGGIPTGLTQNVKDLLASREIENIFENSDFIYMLNQAGGDRQILAKQLNISPHQLSYVTNSNAGEGLLFYGNVIIPFIDHFPKGTELYSIMTTRPEDLAEAANG